MRWLGLSGGAILLLGLALAAASLPARAAAAPLDEAQRAGRDRGEPSRRRAKTSSTTWTTASQLTPDEVKGRNMWLVWTGGNDRFWDQVTKDSLATFDLLKIITSHPSQTYCDGQRCDRDSRWHWLGAVNEPCFEKPTGPDPKRFGLWLDVRGANCAPDPFENEAKYPGVKIGARGTTFKDGSTPAGRLLFRLRHRHPRPAPVSQSGLRPGGEGQVGPGALLHRPELLQRPESRAALSGRHGLRLLPCRARARSTRRPIPPIRNGPNSIRRSAANISGWTASSSTRADTKNFLYQLVHSYPPGTMDTSLVSTDYINNPRTMNAVYLLGPRLAEAEALGQGDAEGPPAQQQAASRLLRSRRDTSWSPRVLKDGSDSVGVMGALNRVYINIGLYSEEWMRHFNPFFGGKPIDPIQIATAEANSAYWRATEAGTPFMAKFLVKAGQPDKLADAPGGEKYLTADAGDARPRQDECSPRPARAAIRASCRTRRAPSSRPAAARARTISTCFKRYWAYTETDDFKAKMRDIVAAPDFLKDNYLSTDARIPVTLLRTNACSPLGTNAIRGNIWDNFSSETYKTLPSVGNVTVQDPFTAERWQFRMPGGGLGFTRVPSLVSIWSTAPFLVNNRLGPFSDDPSVDGRMKLFDASIEQLLWPEKREHEPGFDGYIVRTTERSTVVIPKRSVPVELQNLIGALPANPFRKVFDRDGNFKLGPIPKGFPINLAANFQPRVDIPFGKRLPHDLAFTQLVFDVDPQLAEPRPERGRCGDAVLGGETASAVPDVAEVPGFRCQPRTLFRNRTVQHHRQPERRRKGLRQGASLSDDDKRALIEYLKTF